MGYRTFYELRVKGKDAFDIKTINKLTDWLHEKSLYGYSLHGRFEYEADCVCISGQYEVYWSTHEEDMLDMSMEFPNLTFCLHGEGEVPGDIWNKYFHDGEMEECHATFIMPEPKEIRWEDL